MSTKKQSLFKQKIKQAKLKSEDNNNSPNNSLQNMKTFPKAFKIQDIQKQTYLHNKNNKIQQENTSYCSQHPFQKQHMLQDSQDTFLHKNTQYLQGIISPQQINQIDDQNWKTVDSMSEEQRNNYINLIKSTLPQHFIKKLKKNQKTTKIQKIVQENQNASVKTQHFPHFSQVKHNDTISEEKKEIQFESHQMIIEKLYLNIVTMKLQYLSEEMFLTLSQDQKNNLMNKGQLFKMIKSQNNQSQVIGSKLCLHWFKNIFEGSLMQNSVVQISGLPFHRKILLTELYILLVMIEENIQKTTFKSCFIEMLVNTVEILTLAYKDFTDKQLNNQLAFIQKEFVKTQKNFNNLKCQNNQIQEQEMNVQKQENQIVYQSLSILLSALKQQKEKRKQTYQNKQGFEDFQINNFIKSNFFQNMIETLLIEQTLTQKQIIQYQIQPTIIKVLQKLKHFWENKIEKHFNFQRPQTILNILSFCSFFYELTCKLNFKKRLQPFYLQIIHQIFANLLRFYEYYFGRILEQFSSFKPINFQQETSIKIIRKARPIVLYKVLFIYRELTLNSQKLAQFLQNSQNNWKLSQSQTVIVVFINFSHYLQAQDLKNQEIRILQKMFNWLKEQVKQCHKKNNLYNLNPKQILHSLLQLFLSTFQQIYSLLDQSLLNQVFSEVIRAVEKCNKEKTALITNTQLRKLIQNYNFNSFGNDIFTKLMLWIAVAFNEEFELMITDQVMARYPMLFYYAFQHSETVEMGQNNTQEIEKVNYLGKLQNYVRVNNKPQKNYFTYKSNMVSKAELLKILQLTLDFNSLDDKDTKKILQIVKVDKQRAQGFNTSKRKLDPKNFFYKYLLQPFVNQQGYKEFF